MNQSENVADINYDDVRIYAKCVRVVYLHRIPSIISVFIVSFIPFFIGISEHVPFETHIPVFLLWIYVLVNYILAHRFNKMHVSDKGTVFWGRVFHVQLIVLALLLDAPFFCLEYAGVDNSMLYMTLVSLGYSAGAVSAFHQLKWAPSVFIGSVLAPHTVYYLVLEPSKSSCIVVFMLFLIFLFMSVVSWKQHRNWIKTLAISFELEKARDAAEQAARIDGLTSLFNRKAFYEIAQEFLNNAKRYKHTLSVVMLDVDHFKKINDSSGHAVGDVVLVKIAQILQRTVRECDIAGRIGGEEFVLLLPDTDKDGAFAIVERLREEVQKISLAQSDFDMRVTASFGIAEYGKDISETFDQLLKKADYALYEAKNQGRNRTVIYSG